MSETMPRGRIKEILHTSRIDRSPGKRKCRGDRQNHVIHRGAPFLAIKDGLVEKSYCLKCARIILERGSVKLSSLIDELEKAEKDL